MGRLLIRPRHTHTHTMTCATSMLVFVIAVVAMVLVETVDGHPLLVHELQIPNLGCGPCDGLVNHGRLGRRSAVDPRDETDEAEVGGGGGDRRRQRREDEGVRARPTAPEGKDAQGEPRPCHSEARTLRQQGITIARDRPRK